MTAQVSDFVRFLDEDYHVAGVSGDGLFDPAAYGIKPRMISTACSRGYYCHYAVKDDRFTLDMLHIGLIEGEAERAKRGDGPLVFGVAPRYDHIAHCFEYASLAAPIAYTGGLLIGGDFIWDLYVHMGFHPYWKFRRVIELIFDHGRLVETLDRSQAAEEFRKTLKADGLRPGRGASKAEIMAWIERTFSLRY